jgi:hypothetical protein
VHLVHLIAALQTLDRTWRSRGQTESISAHLEARCIQCGISLLPEEVKQLIDFNPANPALKPKLQRIQRGYCARRTCDSYFYEITVAGNATVDLPSLWDNAMESVSAAIFGSVPERSRPRWQALLVGYDPREILMLALALGTLSFLLWWNLRTPSWATRPSGYTMGLQNMQVPLRP